MFQLDPALPAEAEQPKTLFQESHDCSVSACPDQHPALSSAANTVQGFNNSQGKKKNNRKSKPACQQAPTCVSGLGRILLQLLSPSLQLLRALVGTEAKSFLFLKQGGGKKKKVPFHAWLQSKGCCRLGRGQRCGHFPPSDPSAGAAHILLPRW